MSLVSSIGRQLYRTSVKKVAPETRIVAENFMKNDHLYKSYNKQAYNAAISNTAMGSIGALIGYGTYLAGNGGGLIFGIGTAIAAGVSHIVVSCSKEHKNLNEVFAFDIVTSLKKEGLKSKEELTDAINYLRATKPFTMQRTTKIAKKFVAEKTFD